MRNLSIVALIMLSLLSVTASAQPTFRRNAKKDVRPKYNIEQVESAAANELILKYKGFTVSYNQALLIPNWVAYELTAEEASATNVSRTDEFMPDPNVKGRQADPRDYTGSGFDRGHMAAAADMKWDLQAMQESFYMTNIIPQDRDLNAGLWLELEQKCRYWAKKYDTVWIVCGPMFTTGHNQPIGTNKVYVPDAFFKCVCMKMKDKWTMAAFVFPNLGVDRELDTYIFSVLGLEQLVGHKFFNNVPVSSDELFKLKAMVSRGDWVIPGWKKQ